MVQITVFSLFIILVLVNRIENSQSGFSSIGKSKTENKIKKKKLVLI